MAENIKPENEIPEEITAELSKNDDIVEYIQENSLEALKARFGTAEEDESIRNEGFELATSGGLFIKPRPENLYQYAAGEVNPKEDISTDSESELSKVFESTKSEHDNDNVTFGDLEIGKPETKAEETTEKPAEEPESDEEEIQIVKKYNTHTKVIFSDENLDDGIKRNSDSELEDFFTNEEKGRKRRLWSPKKK